MQKIPLNVAKARFLCREIDFETMKEVTNKLHLGKSLDAHGIPREYCKDDTVLFRERYRAAFIDEVSNLIYNVTHAHQWLTVIVAFAPKILLTTVQLFDSVPRSLSF